MALQKRATMRRSNLNISRYRTDQPNKNGRGDTVGLSDLNRRRTMMGLTSINHELANERRNGAAAGAQLDQAFLQAVRDAAREGVWEALLDIPGVRAAVWMKHAAKKLANKLKGR
jgi:hypothetical protein